MDKFAVSFHTPETKNESKHWLPKGQPGPLKERTQVSRKKQMVFSFFDAAGIIYQHYASLGAKLNAVYLTNGMGKFLRTFRSKRPLQAKKKSILFWDNSALHIAKVTLDFLELHAIETTPHAPYSPDLAPADFFLFPTVKSGMSGVTVGDQTVRYAWEQVCRGIPAPKYATTFKKWLELHEKCIRLAGGYVEKEQ